MKQYYNNHTIWIPNGHVFFTWNCEISYVEYHPIEDNLVIPTDGVQNYTCVGSDASPKARFERG